MMTRGWMRAASLVVFFAIPSYAQLGALEGRVTGPDGERVEGATIMIDRVDIAGHYEVTTNAEGDYRYNGLPVGIYRIALVIDGQERWIETNVRVPFNEILEKNFDLSGRENGGGATASAISEAMNLARSAMAAEDYEEAIRQFTVVVENDATQPVVFGNLALALNRAGRYEEAAENYDRAITLAIEQTEEGEEVPSDVTQWFDNLVVMYVNARNFEAGLAALDRMVAFDAEQAGTRYYDVGRVLVNLGRAEEAVDALTRSIEIDDEHADAYWQLGLAYYGVDRAQESIPVLERYLELAPGGENAEGAKALIQAAEELDP